MSKLTVKNHMNSAHKNEIIENNYKTFSQQTQFNSLNHQQNIDTFYEPENLFFNNNDTTNYNEDKVTKYNKFNKQIPNNKK